ncbi:oxidoreductase [Arthrobacter sp. SW1]|uniref:Gfo/Idh/MocA family protein n=1 Tax=Arthrobacter sp. SW1 TaxID=1920889 RepID=UPI000877E4AE|nr:Gfo/Idh/MocA family oxidoreductase [Arthrobacter sp. SW1]OFI38531.1 oxidoreductase [Arthrobacter sp. SW1]
MTGNSTGTEILGVGIIGAGPVTQAIHMPTLSRLGDLFAVRHIMDADPSVAESVAARAGARHSSSVEELLADPEVDVVAICSPHRFHAEQVIAACRAGRKAVLCEKPFAMNAAEAAGILVAAKDTGVPVVVGAMHAFDPAWLAAESHWGTLPETAHTIRSTIVLPPNSRFEDAATEVLARPGLTAPDYSDPAAVRSALHGGIMGLAIHDLPLVRRFVPHFEDLEILQARHVRPFGYLVSLRAAGRSIELRAAMGNTWKPAWTFEAFSDDAALRVDFSPSYVQAGSAAATLSTANERRSFGPYGHNGYEGEWRELARLAGGGAPRRGTESLIDDLAFALAIAEPSAEAATAELMGADA